MNKIRHPKAFRLQILTNSIFTVICGMGIGASLVALLMWATDVGGFHWIHGGFGLLASSGLLLVVLTGLKSTWKEQVYKENTPADRRSTP